MRLSDILRKKDQQQQKTDPIIERKENSSQEQQNPFLRKDLLEKLKQQNLLPLINDNQTMVLKDGSSFSDSLDNIYGRSIDSFREVFNYLLGSKKNKFFLIDIIGYVKKIIKLANNREDNFLLYCNYSTPDNYIFSHSVNVAILASFLCVEKKLSNEEIFLTTLSAFLHDLGLAKLMPIVNQQRKLNSSEYEEIKKHSLYIEDELLSIELDASLKKSLISIISSVHERVDGSGYPKCLKDKEIPIYSKIISIADIYEAMTHPRPYRNRFLPHNVLVELINLSQTKLDSEITKIFVNRLSLFPIGSYVKLNTEEIGIVVSSNIGFPIRPKVKLVLNPDKSTAKPDVIDLSKESKIFILEPVDDLKIDVQDKKLFLQLKSQYWWVKRV